MRATVVFDMVFARGFIGSVPTVRQHVSQLRPTRWP